MHTRGSAAAKRLALEIVGWTLIVAGIAALVLPGPGLLMLFAGLVVLSQQYEWAERRLEPVKKLAMEGASEGVQTWQRLCLSFLGIAAIAATGVLWIVSPPAPSWWPLHEQWWLFGGPGTGVTLVISSLIGLGLLVYSFRRFRNNPYQHEVAPQKRPKAAR